MGRDTRKLATQNTNSLAARRNFQLSKPLDSNRIGHIVRKLTRVVDDMVRPNGLIFSPDFKTLYIADQAGGKIFAYDVKGAGKLTNKRKFADAGSDGMSIDIDGNVYLTWQGSVIVFDKSGKEIDRLKTPESPANCLLVGNVLYITARKGFYSVETNATGVQ